MAFGVNSVLNMGVGALFASQAAIQTTGNNISNVNTTGYRRQAVVLEESPSIDYYPGQVGQGVKATEVIRYFDAFIEKAYLDKLGTSSRYQAEYGLLRTAETVFNEANVDGISNALMDLFTSWNTLSQEPDSKPAREAMLAKAETLGSSIRNADDALRSLEDQVNDMIKQDVTKANGLIKDIASLNKEITAHYLEGRNNPNQLLDERDRKVRELGAIIDVTVIDRGPNDYMVTTKSGNLLVQEEIPFSLEFRGPSVENNLMADSPYKNTPTAEGTQRTAHFSGRDSHEYTVEMVTDGVIDGTTGNGGATFKVSIDGGKSWLTNPDGTVRTFEAGTEDASVHVGDLDIWFDATAAGEDVIAGDRFVISPKEDVYWIRPTAGPLNISTQIYLDGTDNSQRIVGGSLGGYLEFRDSKIGEYRDRLEAFTDSVAWEVNRIHSQGAGLTPMTNVLGTYTVGRTDVALGSPQSLFSWADRLQTGNMTFEIYDATTNKSMIPYPGLSVFSPPENFDPAQHSLEDVRDALNAASFVDAGGATVTPFSARIVDGKLQLSSVDPGKYTFAVTADTSGLAAGLGINTFFKGDTPGSFGVREELSVDPNLVNAGRVNGAGEMNSGDNITAREIAALATKAVDIGTTWNKSTNQTLTDYYATLVAKIGADTSSVKYTSATETTMAQELHDRQEEIGGVNLDEEMSSLIKFQASYKAAAKLITTADQMIQTLLSLKQ